MNDYALASTVQAVQQAVINLTELVEQTASDWAAKELDVLHEESKEIVLMFIAAIVVSDGKYIPREQLFLILLLDCRGKPGGDWEYLTEYAERWKIVRRRIPRFFQAAIEYDAKHKTGIARAMLREIQLIGNNTCISDGRRKATEREVLRTYLLFLEQHFEKCKLRS